VSAARHGMMLSDHADQLDWVRKRRMGFLDAPSCPPRNMSKDFESNL
jgi:hypothetical protein